jgi:hypothetical protein
MFGPPNGRLNKLFAGGGAVEVAVGVAVGAVVAAGAGFELLEDESVW